MTDTFSDRELADIEARRRIFKPFMGDAQAERLEEARQSALPTSPTRFQPYPAPRIERHQLLEVA